MGTMTLYWRSQDILNDFVNILPWCCEQRKNYLLSGWCPNPSLNWEKCITGGIAIGYYVMHKKYPGIWLKCLGLLANSNRAFVNTMVFIMLLLLLALGSVNSSCQGDNMCNPGEYCNSLNRYETTDKLEFYLCLDRKGAPFIFQRVHQENPRWVWVCHWLRLHVCIRILSREVSKRVGPSFPTFSDR